MTRETENALLLLVGLSTAIIAITGTFTRYVKPALQPWLLASAVVMILLASIAIVADIRHGPHRGGDHDHQHRSGVAWLLVLPIALLAFVVPPALGPQSARPAVAATEMQRRPFPPLPAGPAPELSLPELLTRVAQDSAGTLAHRRVTVTGFTIREPSGIYLGRIVILCCAADAQLASAQLTGPAANAAAALPDGSWVRVQGEVRPDQLTRSTPTPQFSVIEVQQIPPPANTYSY